MSRQTAIIVLYNADGELGVFDLIGESEVVCNAINTARDTIREAIKMINDDQDNTDYVVYDEEQDVGDL